jgi:hypothetical protein
LARVFHGETLAPEMGQARRAMDLTEWLAMMLTLGGGAAALVPSVRSLRSRRHLQIVDLTLGCPRTAQTVHCQMELDPRTNRYEGIRRCSAKEADRRPSCDQDCVRVLNMGIPLRSLAPEAGDEEEALDEGEIEDERG